ncbi:MAG TPA: hypothetical protein VK486_16245 [Thermoleophilaceae bacterium]|nr:hypothetical protein [Thermoleophilaceae bacterium]
MTPERSQAYGRLMTVIATEGDAALTPAEKEVLREAGDALFFCEDVALDEDAREALSRVSDLTGQLVGAERWDPELAEQVLQDLEDSGPPQLVRLGDPR